MGLVAREITVSLGQELSVPTLVEGEGLEIELITNNQ